MQDSDDNHSLSLNTIKDEMLADGMAEIPLSDVIAIPADADILSNQVEGLI